MKRPSGPVTVCCSDRRSPADDDGRAGDDAAGLVLDVPAGSLAPPAATAAAREAEEQQNQHEVRSAWIGQMITRDDGECLTGLLAGHGGC